MHLLRDEGSEVKLCSASGIFRDNKTRSDGLVDEITPKKCDIDILEWFVIGLLRNYDLFI